MTIVAGIIGCFACSGADHWESACPELIPVKTRKEHEARIAKYVEWCNGQLPLPGRVTPWQKQKLIAAENARWKKSERKTA